MPRKQIDVNEIYSSTGTAIGGVLIVGKDPAFLSILERAYKLASSDISILLHGETGTGKGFLARVIHQWSGRSSGPYVPLNCGELTESLAESELFGHAEGAFTGALMSRAGLVKQADHGTLFNDELDSLPQNVQPKLLRFTDTGEYRPVGCVHSEKVNVRLISATLSHLSAQNPGKIRPDLFHRLAQYTLHIPALRDRPADIPILAMHFLDAARAEGLTHCTDISDECLRALLSYSWPGNVRELRGAIRVAAFISEGTVLRCPDLSIPKLHTAVVKLKRRQKERHTDVDQEVLHDLLVRSGGDVHRAAILGDVSVRTVYRKVKDHALNLQAYRPKSDH